MKITDSPHRAGTPEHNTWIRETFIPAVRDERFPADRAKYGAPAIGRNTVRGGSFALASTPPPLCRETSPIVATPAGLSFVCAGDVRTDPNWPAFRAWAKETYGVDIA